MSQSHTLIDLPFELNRIEIASYLDIASFAAFSMTTMQLYRLFLDDLVWQARVHRDLTASPVLALNENHKAYYQCMHDQLWKRRVDTELTKYPDLAPGESYKAYYQRMQRERSNFRFKYKNKTELLYAYHQGFECLARQLVRQPINRFALDADTLKELLTYSKPRHPEMINTYFDSIQDQHIYYVRRKSWWVSLDIANDNDIACNANLVKKFFLENQLYQIIEDIKTYNERWSDYSKEKIRLLLFVKYVVLNDDETNDAILVGLSEQERVICIKRALIYVLSMNDFVLRTSHVLSAVDALLYLLPTVEQLSFIDEFLNDYPACIAKLNASDCDR